MLSKKTRLCVKVLVAMASASPVKPVTVHALSAQLRVSVSHLESIMRSLREAGFVSAARGPGGGYYTTCNPDTATIWDVVLQVDSEMQQAPSEAELTSPIASLEASIRRTFVDYLASRTVGEFAQPNAWHAEGNPPAQSRFRLGPMPPALRPVAPRSVFELADFALGGAVGMPA